MESKTELKLLLDYVLNVSENIDINDLDIEDYIQNNLDKVHLGFKGLIELPDGKEVDINLNSKCSEYKIKYQVDLLLNFLLSYIKCESNNTSLFINRIVDVLFAVMVYTLRSLNHDFDVKKVEKAIIDVLAKFIVNIDYKLIDKTKTINTGSKKE